VKSAYWLSELGDIDRHFVGEKAHQLRLLLQENYPVVDGFVISSAIAKQVFRELELNFKGNDRYLLADPYALQEFSQRSQKLIVQSELQFGLSEIISENLLKLHSDNLILRPSLAVNINTKGLLASTSVLSSLPEIINGLKEIWSKLFSARSIFYWLKRGMDLEQIGFAILVQPISSTVVSGRVLLENQTAQIQTIYGLGHGFQIGGLSGSLHLVDLATGNISLTAENNQNLAYQIIAGDLSTYELSHEQKKLSDYYLQKNLISQLKRLNQQKSYNGYLDWTILESEQFYFTGANLQVNQSVRAIQRRFKGKGVSPGQVIAPIEIILQESEIYTKSLDKRILVLKQVLPIHLSLLKNAAGLVTEIGSTTSHGAIVARELGIPSVVGIAEATSLLKSGESVFLDGDKGELYSLVGPIRNFQSFKTPPEISIDSNTIISTELMVNLSQPVLAEAEKLLPILDGVGLLRSESFFAQCWLERPANQWNQRKLKDKLIDFINEFVILFGEKPISYRLLDQQGDQILSPTRGTAGYLEDTTVLDIQLEALLAVQNLHNKSFNILLPFVRTLDEFKFCQREITKKGLKEHPLSKVWVTVEVPSAVLLLSEYIEAGAEGFAIGTNDLMQLLLGYDRDFPISSKGQCPKALKQVIQTIIEISQQSGLPCSICGQATLEYPDLLDCLVQWGISSISVEPWALFKTHKAIARAEQNLILRASRKIIGL
jgi:pyruvate,water dikinase